MLKQEVSKPSHKPNACWKCHKWLYIDINGRKVATYCDECNMTVDEWIKRADISPKN